MKVERLRVQNFKSIREAEIEFGDLNILIGKNAAGKSNIFEIFQFLKDIGEQNLENAIQLRGGVEYFRNIRLNKETNFKISCDFSQSERRHGGRLETEEGDYHLSAPYSSTYNLEISFLDGDYKVIDEEIVNLKTARETEGGIGDGFSIEETISRDEGQVIKTVVSQNDEINFQEQDEGWGFRRGREISEKESFFSSIAHPRVNFTPGLRSLNHLQLYDIDTRRIKEGTTLKGKTELEGDGSNLPLVLKRIVTSHNEKEKFLNIANDVLPFLKDWQTDTLRDKSVFLKLLEEFEEKDEEYIPANMVSDGTLHVIALIVILYFERNDIVLIEEPEKSIHPSLISKIVDMMEDVTANSEKQVFATTHNVEFIKNVDLDDILLVNRDEFGFSEVEKPSDDSHVRQFLNEGMGLGELYVNNILEEEI